MAGKDGAAMRNSKGGWLLYLMIGVPWFWWVKIGITHVSIGAFKRAFSVGKAFVGFPFPIMFVPIPGAYGVEQWLHRVLAPLSCRFYRGDGASEWYWLPVIVVVLPVMLLIVSMYLVCFDMALGTAIYPVVSGWFFDALFFIFGFV